MLSFGLFWFSLLSLAIFYVSFGVVTFLNVTFAFVTFGSLCFFPVISSFQITLHFISFSFVLSRSTPLRNLLLTLPPLLVAPYLPYFLSSHFTTHIHPFFPLHSFHPLHTCNTTTCGVCINTD